VEVTLLARAQFTLPGHFGKIKQSHAELVFRLALKKSSGSARSYKGRVCTKITALKKTGGYMT